MTRVTRREFVKATMMLAAGAGVPGRGLLRATAHGMSAATEPEGEWRNKQSEMRYRKLGRTGFMISEIVCGGDPISPTNNRHVELAIDLGLNYLDTAPAYGDGQSEMGYSAVIEGAKRDRVFLNTKVSPFVRSHVEAYRKIFSGLSREEQARILREASEVLERRRVTLPNYLGYYYTGQFQQAEQSAIAEVMERKYAEKIERRETYVDTIIRIIVST